MKGLKKLKKRDLIQELSDLREELTVVKESMGRQSETLEILREDLQGAREITAKQKAQILNQASDIVTLETRLEILSSVELREAYQLKAIRYFLIFTFATITLLLCL